jgi:hypothetical protein
VPEDAGIEPRTVATLALAIGRSTVITRLDLIHNDKYQSALPPKGFLTILNKLVFKTGFATHSNGRDFVPYNLQKVGPPAPLQFYSN